MGKSQNTNHFPSRLHDMLDDAPKKGHSHIVSWSADGMSFKIHDPAAMVPILKNYFRQTKYKSLLRQLQGYRFNRVTNGENKGQVSHPSFIRGLRSKSMNMKRKPTKPSTPKVPIPFEASINSDATVSKPEFCGSVEEENKFQPPEVVSSDAATTKNEMKQLESSFQSVQNQHVLQTISLMGNHSIVGDNAAGHHGQHRPSGIEALRVEIGCTISSTSGNNNNDTPRLSTAKSSSSLKRMAPPLHQHYIVHSSLSAPNLETKRITKRQRSHEQIHRHHSYNVGMRSSRNASFPHSMIGLPYKQSQDDSILMEEKMKFQEAQRKQNQFEKFIGLPQVTSERQFHQTQHAKSPIGTLDLDISLTTTTTTMHPDGKGTPHVSSETICNKFVLPTECEPTPLPSPRHGPQKDPKHSIVLSVSTHPSKTSVAPESFDGGDSFTQETEVSDEIDVGIAEAFDGDDKWQDLNFDSDCESDDKSSVVDDWTVAVEKIVFDGESDCVLETNLFQLEEQQLHAQARNQFSSQQLPKSHPNTFPSQQTREQELYKHQLQLQQLTTMQKSIAHHLPRYLKVPQRRPAIPQQFRQLQAVPQMGNPYQTALNPIGFDQRYLLTNAITQVER
jgi:hypothetical protein